MSFLSVVSTILGWAYFLAWSASFYPQLILNVSRKSVVGLSFDYLNYNFLGFLSYSIFNCAFYWNSTIQEQYFARHGGDEIPVELNDVVFALHALLLTTITIGTCFIFERGPNNRNSIACIVIAGSLWISIYIIGLLSLAHVVSWLDYMYYFSYVKLFITFVKYVPQVFMNWKRQSTVGWSIWQVTLDFSGGLMSLLQILLDAIDTGNWAYVTGNWSKIGLSLFSLLFDSIFIVQHYVLYPQPKFKNQWNNFLSRLLGDRLDGCRSALSFSVNEASKTETDTLLY